jgi:hypothetical protein
MSVTYTIDKPFGLIHTRCFGHVTLREAFGSRSLFTEDARELRTYAGSPR